jgi:hypothetical protein
VVLAARNKHISILLAAKLQEFLSNLHNWKC